ncbi:hypothetical protein OHA79_04025 [Streptomyces sp. NBC_00841]|uniref:hypothetical protein n=1 Tax=unclassified Streptomyces TaxID=2593676 RepID=UPI00224D8CFA|nr:MULTISPECIES: hypothetical protein [unclassified Streptomyces]WRZ97152.1 hypothetical protein OHA79_04025 [Streptomyces sp. NBC_00841]
MRRCASAPLPRQGALAAEPVRARLGPENMSPGRARAEAEALAAEITSFPQACLRGDRASVLDHGGHGRGGGHGR